MSEEDVDQDLLKSLCQEASSLVGRLPGKVTRVKLSAGEYRVDIEWEQTAYGPAPAMSAGGAAYAAADDTAAADAAPDNRHAILAVLVGTFYRSGEPGSPAFVEVGDVVEEGQDVAIIEAMKVMNHIQADRAGRVAEILVKNGEMVEFEQRLVILEPVEDER